MSNLTTKSRWSRREKRVLLLSGCGSLLLFGLGELHAWNNRVPELIIPQVPAPRLNGFDFLRQAADQVVEPPPYSGVDAHFDSVSQNWPRPYSRADNQQYPLEGRQALLKRNSGALRLLRHSLNLPFLQSPQRHAKDVAPYAKFRVLSRILFVEAHARAQSGNWDGAADSLLDVWRLSDQIPRGAALRGALVGVQMRNTARHEAEWVLPHLSEAKARAMARVLESQRRHRVGVAEVLEEEKRAMQGTILDLLRAHDLRTICARFTSSTAASTVAAYQNSKISAI